MTKSEQLPNLCTAINRAERIVRTGDVYTFSYAQCGYTISKTDLEAIDARLPTCINYLLNRDASATPAALRQTVEHWLSPSPQQEHTKNRYISNPTFIEASTTPDIYLLRTNRYMTSKLANDIEVAIPLDEAVWIPVSSAWLDQYYPTVRHKINLLNAMGLLKEEISKHAVANMGSSLQSAHLTSSGLYL